jgi:hypothetical protein
MQINMKVLFLILFLISYLTNYSQSFIKKDNRTFYVERVCEIKSRNPDCFRIEIPFKYRTNQKDTIRYCFLEDSCFLFYKGKCDTICYYDTTEHYFFNRNLYNGDTINIIDEITITDFSKILKHFNEPNLWADKDTSSIIYRFSYFRDTLPIFYRIEKRNNIAVLFKKISNGNFIYTDSIISEKTTIISDNQWSKLHRIINYQDIYKPKKKFMLIFPDLLIEIKIKDNYQFIYLNYSEWEITKSVRKQIRKIEKRLYKY